MTDKRTRTETGRVISSSRDKSITVLVERKVKHPLYKKIMRRSSKLQAHDQDNICNAGDLVTIQECRPISKTKSWNLLKERSSTLCIKRLCVGLRSYRHTIKTISVMLATLSQFKSVGLYPRQNLGIY